MKSALKICKLQTATKAVMWSSVPAQTTRSVSQTPARKGRTTKAAFVGGRAQLLTGLTQDALKTLERAVTSESRSTPGDPFCEPQQVVVYRTKSGGWAATHPRTLNSLWCQMPRITVDTAVQFQFGEQRFRLQILGAASTPAS
jgi:hypothetical protein